MSKALEVDAANFETEVINASTPVLVDFWASWCMPCKMLAPVVDQIADEFVNKVKVVKVDVDTNQPLAAKFGVRGIPTLLLMDNGKEAGRMVGMQPKAAIAQKINDLLGV